jgi:hypothetical protein
LGLSPVNQSHPRLIDALADHYRLERELGVAGMAPAYPAGSVRHGRQRSRLG